MKPKQKHNTIFDGHHYTQTNTNNVNNVCCLPHSVRRQDCEFHFYH